MIEIELQGLPGMLMKVSNAMSGGRVHFYSEKHYGDASLAYSQKACSNLL
jgi:hypothetical protein